MKLALQKRAKRQSLNVGRSRFRSSIHAFDWGLLFIVLLIAGIGLLNLYSATYGTAHARKFEQQVIWMGLGLCCFSTVSFLDYRSFHRWSWLAHVGVIVLIISVRLFFDPIKGSHRWMVIGPMRLQPTELAKLAIIISLAKILHDWDENKYSWKRVSLFIALLILPVLLVGMQPDLGSASLLGLILISVSLLLIKTIWPLILILLTGLATLPLFWENMQGYQQRRVLVFLDPSADPKGSAWQTIQSMKAIGSGRITGKGFKEATQNHFEFLPEHWTDFPFAVWAEEWGFIGSVFLVMIFMILVLWIVNIALNSVDKFGQAMCLGVAAMFFFHTVVNILMVSGWAPVVGVPLPLISYGGSSVLTMMTGLGIVSAVSRRSRAIQ